jgi:hypothetical protein
MFDHCDLNTLSDLLCTMSIDSLKNHCMFAIFVASTRRLRDSCFSHITEKDISTIYRESSTENLLVLPTNHVELIGARVLISQTSGNSTPSFHRSLTRGSSQTHIILSINHIAFSTFNSQSVGVHSWFGQYSSERRFHDARSISIRFSIHAACDHVKFDHVSCATLYTLHIYHRRRLYASRICHSITASVMSGFHSNHEAFLTAVAVLYTIAIFVNK